jgi:hypothetical protein
VKHRIISLQDGYFLGEFIKPESDESDESDETKEAMSERYRDSH